MTKRLILAAFVAAMALTSCHNRIREGYTYYYNTDNSLLISAAAENDSVYYHYIEQTVE